MRKICKAAILLSIFVSENKSKGVGLIPQWVESPRFFIFSLFLMTFTCGLFQPYGLEYK
ncbi:MAG: hypothetical protein NZ455_02600 [Bacteroidia bacterium]|nr:hypothetical protein [Bacteroidia bacterium]